MQRSGKGILTNQDAVNFWTIEMQSFKQIALQCLSLERQSKTNKALLFRLLRPVEKYNRSPCRDLGALAEWRWLLDHAHQQQPHTRIEARLFRRMQKLVWKRCALHEPIQYLLGTQPFLGMELLVRPPVLIPRPETEDWVNVLVEQLPKSSLRVLDACTGSGCIGLALARQLNKVIAVDLDSRAVALAKENALQLRIPMQVEQADIFNTNAIESLFNSQIDLIVSNPPYIPFSHYDELDPSVRKWESKEALVCLPNGNPTFPLDDYTNGIALHKQLIQLAAKCTASQGHVKLAIEIDGDHQVAPLVAFAHQYGLSASVYLDFNQRSRALFFR